MNPPALPALIRSAAEHVLVAAVVGVLVAGPVLLRQGAAPDPPASAEEIVAGIGF